MYLNLKTIIVEKFCSFCKHSTMHGFYYFSERRPKLIYIIWAVIILSGLGLCIFLSNMIWQKFSIDSTFTVVENTRYPISNIKFPAVIVCNNGMVYAPNTENITDILTRRGFTDDQISEFYESFSAVKNAGYKPKSYIKKMHIFLQELGFTWDQLLEMFRKPCNVLLRSCMWRSKQYTCSHMFTDEYNLAGHCCRFDINYFRKNAEAGTTLNAGMDTNEALSVAIEVHNENLDGTVNQNDVTVFVLDTDRYVTFTDTAITLSRSAFYDVNVNVWAIDSSDDVKALSPKRRQCILEQDQALGYSYFSYDECVTELILKKVVTSCHCLPFKFTASELQIEQYAPCSWDRLSCVHQNIAKIQSNMRSVSNTAEETCLAPCDYVQYETETSFIGYRGELKNSSSVHVAVHFGSNTCLKYRREVIYTWDQMLANLGGIFGLCLGGSVISIIELVWFVLDLLFTAIFVSKNNKVNQYGKEKVFTISQRNQTTKDTIKIKKQGRFKFVN